MEKIINFISSNLSTIQTVFPAIITSVAGFLVAKYTYNKNVPLDKLEFAYNEVYYPIYIFIKNNYKNKDLPCFNEIYVTKKSLQIYFDKYEKYLDFSTIKIFNGLCNSKTKSEEKALYKKFVDNIYNMNTYLRKRLGYLEPNIFQLYKYSLLKDKIFIWGILIIAIGYICIIFCTMYENEIPNSLMVLTILCFFTAIILLFIRFIIFVIDKMKTIFFI